MDQAPVIHYMPKLFKMIMAGALIVSHKMRLDQASEAYQIFNDHEDNCVKVVLKP
jgi:S-(hydroxymethyl)glutathione dehydrogenase/alcohol dehydrogenase